MASSSSDNETNQISAVESSSSSGETDEIQKSEEKRGEIKQEEGKSLLAKVWSGLGFLFHNSSNEDFEIKLQNLSKEEATARNRLKRWSESWTRLAKGLIIYSIILELLFLSIAVIMTRAPELSWQTRALRVLPVFAIPALASLVYSSCSSYYRMRERKDQKLLDRLCNERTAKINELKARTNYYLTQQLIHKYDSDPAAKEAAARVLAAKLGSDAGLALALEQSNVALNEHRSGSSKARMQNVEPLDASGLGRRAKHQQPSASEQSFSPPGRALGESTLRGDSGEQPMELDQLASRKHGGTGGGGWLERLAAILVGEDPTQCYAMICKNCHMHNGLARREDFQYIAYYCPHCHCLNGSRQLGESAGDDSTPPATTPLEGDWQALQQNKILKGDDTEAVAPQPALAESFVTASEQNNGTSVLYG